MGELLDKHILFRRLHFFTLATIVQLETLRFSWRFLTQDPREVAENFFSISIDDKKTKCGKPMRKRQSAKGVFWDCLGFPECKGTRKVSGPHWPC